MEGFGRALRAPRNPNNQACKNNQPGVFNGTRKRPAKTPTDYFLKKTSLIVAGFEC